MESHLLCELKVKESVVSLGVHGHQKSPMEKVNLQAHLMGMLFASRLAAFIQRKHCTMLQGW